LHSFEYPESEKSFRTILEKAPNCSMARWGIAMSLWHPLWAPPGDAALAAGEAILENASGGVPTQREVAYLEAIRAFYANHPERSHTERAEAYRARMEKVYRAHLEDPEAAIFYALSLLATASAKDKTYANQFKAAGLLNWVRNDQPHHPGVLHYLIHSYDFPGLAHLALPAAKIYADVAPASAHAQHMPSHIFTRLGLWERSISSNHDSTASAARYTKRAKLPGHYDEGLHSMDYLLYALLQTARDDEARAHLERLSKIGKANLENFKVAYAYAAAPARFTLERRAWREASQIELGPGDFPWSEFPWARSIVHFARGVGAARIGDLVLARAERDHIVEIRSSLDPETLPYWREEVFVHADAVSSWIELRDGDVERALELARAAADREDAVDKHPVTPGEVVPARELLGDMLLELGRASDARAEYEEVLESSPNRWNALLGVARAALEGGDPEAARSYFERVVSQSDDSNSTRSALQEARSAIEGRE
jgi:tetratricopeptide (TPR) repeat protein